MTKPLSERIYNIESSILSDILTNYDFVCKGKFGKILKNKRWKKIEKTKKY